MTKDEVREQVEAIHADALAQSGKLLRRIDNAVNAAVYEYANGLQTKRGPSAPYYPPVVLTSKQLAEAVSVGVLASLEGFVDAIALAASTGECLQALAQQAEKEDGKC